MQGLCKRTQPVRAPRLDASQPDQREVLHRFADRLAIQGSWAAWRRVSALIDAGERAELERREMVTRLMVDVMDDPGYRGTHTRAEAYDAAGRKYRIHTPWQRQSAKGDRSHVERKKHHAITAIMDRAIRNLLTPWRSH